MLTRVRERVLGALAGTIDEEDPTDEASEAAFADLPAARRRRRRSRSFSTAGAATIEGLSEALLAGE